MLGTTAFVLTTGVPLLQKSTFTPSLCISSTRRVMPTTPGRPTRTNVPPRMCDEKKPAQDPNDGRATSGLFGIRLETNGDVIKFGFAAIAFAYGIKTILQLLGTPDLLAGQMTTGFVSVFALLGWVSTYVFRVGTKGMTYAQQLREYEDAVIQKRYEELSEEELKALGEELSDEA